jgi:hypothetical protein
MGPVLLPAVGVPRPSILVLFIKDLFLPFVFNNLMASFRNLPVLASFAGLHTGRRRQNWD